MKLDTNMYQGKPPSLEEGPMRYETTDNDSNSNRVGRSNRCNRCIQFMKVILYLELILLIGWAGCMFITNYYEYQRYNSVNGPYDITKSAQDQNSQYSPINSDYIPVEDIEWSPRDDDTKNTIEKSEPYIKSVIEDKNDVIMTETTITPSFVETDDTDINRSIFLSWWLENFNSSIDNWEESSSKYDSLLSRMMTSVEEKNDNSDTSSDEKITLNEDSDTASTTQNYFGTMDKENNEFHEINIEDLLAPALWRDSLWTSDYADETTLSNKDLFKDQHIENFRFDFQLPELWEPFLSMESQARTTIGQVESSSSSSSEEMKSSAPKAKRSTESSSSSSSEETISPAPKVKRSTDSSSSESDSSDSSSSENDQTTAKSINGEKSCPQILDDDGSTIDDPKDIVNHIKRNWFNWLLETPVPDCDGTESVKTVTIDGCGKFVIRCTLDESDETSGKSKESVMNHRDTRSVEENDVDRQSCERSVNVTRENFEKLTMDVIIGEPSDPTVINLRKDFAEAVMALTIRVMIEQSIGAQNKTDEEWQNYLVELRHNITESTDTNYRRQLVESGPPTRKMADDLRNAVESMISVYTNCNDMLTTSEETKTALMVLKMLIEREKCLISFEKMQMRKDLLAAEIVAGESSDSTVIELRQRFKDMITLFGTAIAFLGINDSEMFSAGAVNGTDDSWRTYMLKLKEEIAKFPEDPAVRQRIESSGPPTEEQTNQLREIVEYYIHEHMQCITKTLLVLADVPRYMEQGGNRIQRSASSKWEPGYIAASDISDDERYSKDKSWFLTEPEPNPIVINCWVEDDYSQLLEERQARLECWTTKIAMDKPYIQGIKSLMDTIEAEVSAENPSEISMNNVLSNNANILSMTNHLLANSSSDLRREGYELLRDIVLEFQKLDYNDMMNLTEKLMNCLMHTPGNVTAEFVFTIVIETGEAMNLRYSELGERKTCSDPYNPVYGHFTYTGEEPEKSSVRNWRHILDAIVRLYFKIHDPNALPGSECDPSDADTQMGLSENERTIGVVKRSIGYSIRKPDNSVSVDSKIFPGRDDTGSLRGANLDVNAEARNFDTSQKMFFDKMETLSSHIDRLHELYQRLNELNDDYVSKEFNIESPLNYE